jgi:hypothetical protein
MLRVIPIVKPGTTASTVALARTDEEETAARQKAAAEGLIAGAAQEVEPNPDAWGVIDHIKSYHARQQ